MSVIMRHHSIPTPYPVGPASFYEFEINGKLILVDTGPSTPECFEYLKRTIDLDRLDYIFITHFHPDHFGGIEFLQHQSNAEVVVSKYDVFLQDYFEERVAFFSEIFPEMGFSLDISEKVLGKLASLQKMMPKVNGWRILEESEELLNSLGMKYLLCPGHSQSDIVYLIGDYAVTGDILLHEVFQSPLLDLDFTTLSGRYSNYSAYCQTLSNLNLIKNYKILPAHNFKIESVEDQISFYVDKMRERATTMAPLLEEKGSICETLFSLLPDIIKNPVNIYLKSSEMVFLKDYLDKPKLLENALLANNLKMTKGESNLR